MNLDNSFIYRFRSMQNVFERNELEEQTLFFASAEELNDPMEGFSDFCWNGNRTLWTSLIKHYILCLSHVFQLFLLGKGVADLKPEDIPVFMTERHSPTLLYNQMLSDLWSAFFQNSNAHILYKSLISRKGPLREDELIFFLTAIHPCALKAIIEVFSKNELVSYELSQSLLNEYPSEKFPTDNFGELINMLEEKGEGVTDISTKIFRVFTNITSQLSLFQKLTDCNLSNDKRLIFFDFSASYISQLKKLIFPPWYASCFSKTISNPTMWTHYADGHKGVCFKFRTERKADRDSLRVYKVSSGGGNKKHMRYNDDYIPMSFYKIQYEERYKPIKFFDYFGSLPLPDINWWFSQHGENGDPGPYFGTMNEKDWRKNYWSLFENAATTKTKDWKYEDEYRLLLHSEMQDLNEKQDRALKFRLEDLEGIIFGIKTPEKDKIECLKRVEKICDSLSVQAPIFYQAYYSHELGRVEANELGLFKWE